MAIHIQSMIKLDCRAVQLTTSIATPLGSHLSLFTAIAVSKSPYGSRFMAAFTILVSLWSLVLAQDPDDPHKPGGWIKGVLRNIYI